MARLFINSQIISDEERYVLYEDGITFSDIKGFLEWMSPGDNVIDIEINSVGGSCIEGFAIYDALRASGKEISAKVLGECSSIATIVMLAAPLERRTMYENARLMIHEPYFCSMGKGPFTVDDIEKTRKDLEAERERMMNIYVERTGMSYEDIEAQVKDGGWMNAERAKELGFIADVIPAISAKRDVTINKAKMKGEKVTVKEAFAMLAKALGLGETAKAMQITTASGDVLTVEREEGEIQVGDAASPDGEFVLEDGRKVNVENGVITSIEAPEPDEMEQMKKEIEDLKATIEELKSKAKTEGEAKIIAMVEKAGGEKWLEKAASSSYVPAARSKSEPVEKKSLIEQRLEALRNKNK